MSGANHHVSISATEGAQERHECGSRKRTRDDAGEEIEVDKRPFTIKVMMAQ
jgi:hypothetical protein